MTDIIANCELNRLIHASARYLDDHDFQAYLALYKADGVYTIMTKAPELPEPMVWMQRSRGELQERIAAITEQEWEIVDIEQTRVLSVDLIEVDGDTANTSSSFVLYHTSQDGITSCYAVGRYDDCWEKDTHSWLLRSRQVGLKNKTTERAVTVADIRQSENPD